MTRYPLFALPLVACPRELVPLHVFEPRYRAMIQHCLQEQKAGRAGEFVVAYSADGEMQAVGCVVKLIKVLKHYEDGRMDIITVGRRRVELKKTGQTGLFPAVDTVPYEDETTDWSEKLATQAFNLHRGLVEMITGKKPDEHRYAGISDLSFLIASSIGLDWQRKQKLIMLRSEDERLKLLNRTMRQFVQQLKVVHDTAHAMQGYWELQKLFDQTG